MTYPSHVIGVVVPQSAIVTTGPDSGIPSAAPNTWTFSFPSSPIADTKFIILHFTNANLPANNRVEVDLGYDTDVFRAADGTEFWTRPININDFAGGPIVVRYITDGAATGGIQLDKYGLGERHAGSQDPTSLSNCDPFLKDPFYTEPKYDPYWYCVDPPKWENVGCVTDPNDVRARIARSVGMLISIVEDEGMVIVSSCTVTLVDKDKILTAGHCHTPDEALTSSVTFDYQTDCAGNRPPGYRAQFYKVKEVLKHQYDGSTNPDYSLLRLATAPAGIPALQMRPDIPAPGEQIFGIHHPNGAIKKLSIPHPGFDTVIASSADAIQVPKDFHVSGGSSGSSLFDTAGRTVGVLSNGSPCGSQPTYLKYYPTSSILKAIAPAPPVPVTRDVMVVFDHSGSMLEIDSTGRTKIDSARDAVSLFIQLVQSGTGNRIGLVSFSTAATLPTDFPIADVNIVNKEALIGPAPYSGGKVGGLQPNGATSIGAGLDAARLQFPVPGTNPRAILLMTDGMQNTPPLISGVEGLLSGIDIHVIGLGTEANLDGVLLSKLATDHGGVYNRGEGGVALEKFFSHAFGNIFAGGILMDPEYDLPAGRNASQPVNFHVCGENEITVVVGWDRPNATLFIELTTPAGVVVAGGSPSVEITLGRTWSFLRLPLPHSAERDGLWSVAVLRSNETEWTPLHYFINVIPTGGPRLIRVQDIRTYYTGDSINPLVRLRYPDGSWPKGAAVELTHSRPNASVGSIASQEGLHAPLTIGGDTIPTRQATLTAVERESGNPILNYEEETFSLSEDAASTGGAFEAAALFGKPLSKSLTVEGNHLFHFRASYGQDCIATRELLWSLHVEVGIDPSRTDIITRFTGRDPDGLRTGSVTIIPRDRYGNELGPGKIDKVSIVGSVGTTVIGSIIDNGDGSYTSSIAWDPLSGQSPGVAIVQPGRQPIVVQQPSNMTKDCTNWSDHDWPGHHKPDHHTPGHNKSSDHRPTHGGQHDHDKTDDDEPDRNESDHGQTSHSHGLPSNINPSSAGQLQSVGVSTSHQQSPINPITVTIPIIVGLIVLTSIVVFFYRRRRQQHQPLLASQPVRRSTGSMSELEDQQPLIPEDYNLSSNAPYYSSTDSK